MDDLNSTLSSILSDPNAMKQIEALASQLGLGQNTEQEAQVSRQDTQEAGFNLNPEMLQKVMTILSNARKNNPSTALLIAIRPMLSPPRQEKLDRAIQMLQLTEAAEELMKVLEL